MFENLKKFNEKLKDNYLAKLEKTCIKSEIDGEVVYLGKGSALGVIKWIPFIGMPIYRKMSDWKRVYPGVNENRKWNKTNLIIGGWRNLVYLLIVLGMIAFVFLGVKSLLGNCSAFMDAPCKYMTDSAWQVCKNSFGDYINISLT